MSQSGIRDNHDFVKVGNFLKEKIQPNAQLRFVSAYFSIFGFEALREQLLSIDKTVVKDVKQDVLNYLTQLCYNHSPQFIYYKTLYS